ncbi:MAG: MFS transporter [Coriobacteriia bacterium]|nr:MFS transporter [Coriobacteriia bacterium]
MFKLHPKHYERVVCACCFLFLFVNIGLPSTSFNVYQPYIVAVPGIGDTGGSLVLAVRTFVSLLCMFEVAKWYQLLDCRLGAFISCCLTALGFLVYGFADSLPLFCLGAAIAGAGYGLGGMVCMTLLVGRWFESNVGTAVGIAACGSGVASVVMPIIAHMLIESYSLSVSFWFEASLAVVVGLLVVLLLRNRPQEVGADPYVNPHEAEDGKPHVHMGSTRPLRPLAHHAMFLGMICIGGISVGGFGYLGILMTSSGFAPLFGAFVLSVAGLALTLGKFVTGIVFDAVGTRLGSLIFFLMMITGLVMCCFAGMQNEILMACGAILLGLGSALGTVGISVWSLDLSTPLERTRLVRDLQIAYAFGGFAFNFIPGPLMDLLGTYSVSYGILTAMAVVAFLVVMLVYLKKGPATAISARRG